MTAAKFTIGHIAQAAGVHVETVRYYQRRGLVSLPPKRARGFRYYTPETASRVRFIKRAQALGMSLKEVQRLLKLESKGACKETRSLAVAKLALVESKWVFGTWRPTIPMGVAQARADLSTPQLECRATMAAEKKSRGPAPDRAQRQVVSPEISRRRRTPQIRDVHPTRSLATGSATG